MVLDVPVHVVVVTAVAVAVAAAMACARACAKVCFVICVGRLISSMSQHVAEQVAVKYVRPCKAEDGMDTAAPDFEYRRVVKYNYSPTDLSVLVGTVGMIKSLQTLLLVRGALTTAGPGMSCFPRTWRDLLTMWRVPLQEHEAVYAPKLRAHVYNDVQVLSHKLMTNQLVKVRGARSHRASWWPLGQLVRAVAVLNVTLIARGFPQAVRKKNAPVEHILRVVRGVIAEWSSLAAEDEVPEDALPHGTVCSVSSHGWALSVDRVCVPSHHAPSVWCSTRTRRRRRRKRARALRTASSRGS